MPNVGLDLLPPVKLTSAPVAGTHNVGMDGAVDPLCGCPQTCETELGLSEDPQLFEVDFLFAWDTMLAKVSLLGVDRDLATQAGGLLHSKHGEVTLPSHRCRDEDLACVVSLK